MSDRPYPLSTVDRLRVRYENSGWLPFVCFAHLGHNNTANGNVFMATVGRKLLVRSWHQTFYVDTTNDGSNYWTVALKTIAGTTVASFSTATYAASTYHNKATLAVDHFLESADEAVYLEITKTGSPGYISLACPALYCE